MNKLLIALVASLLIQGALSTCGTGSKTMTVNVAGVQATSTGSVEGKCVTECLIGHYVTGGIDTDGNSCTQCPADLPLTADNVQTTSGGCKACTDGKLCTQSTTADVSLVNCNAGFYCVAGVATACPADKYSAAGAKDVAVDCQVLDAAATKKTGCQSYQDSGAAKCASPLPGFVLNDAKTLGLACGAGCKTCSQTGDVVGNCVTALAGYFLGATPGATATVCPAVTFSTDGNTAASCTACGATLNCATCENATACLTCAAGFYPDPTVTTSVKCIAYPADKLHGTCLTGQGSTSADCNTCSATLNRAIAVDSSNKPLAKGACNCNAGYADYTVASSTNFACMACGSPASNYATCTFNSAGSITAVTCNSASTIGKAGMTCATLAASTAPSGFFFNSASNTFVACGANCNACTTASVCTACADLASTFGYPTASSDSKFGTYLTAPKRALWNGVCSDNCPTGTTANSDKSNCTNATTAGGAGSGAASGVFAVFALIASLFIVF